MSGEVVGQAVNAVLAPPQAERFAGVAGVDLVRLALNVTGWNKLVLLDSDRVFLFRVRPSAWSGSSENLPSTGLWPRRSWASCRACWAAGRIRKSTRSRSRPSPACVARCQPSPRPPSSNWARSSPAGRAQAARACRGAPPRHHDAAHHRWLRRALDPATSAEATAEAADRLDRPGRASAWADLLASAAQLAPVGRRRHSRRPVACRRRAVDRHHRLGDGPGRPPVLGFRSRRVGYRAVAAPPPRLQRPVGARVARVCPGTGVGRRLRAAGGRLSPPARDCLLADPGDPAVVGTLEEHLAQL